MWNDNDTSIDLIDFDHLAFGVTNIIKNENLLPCTIGIFGDWGSGKSSLLRMVEEKIQNENDLLVVRFNGWLFEGYDDAKAAIATTIIEKVISKKTLTEKAKDIARRLFKQIDWLKTAKYVAAHGVAYLTTGGIGNVAIEAQRLIEKKKESGSAEQGKEYEALIEKLTTQGENDSFQSGAKNFHSDFAALLKETSVKKLIVLIDDLDRCNADTVISILEAIKLFLFAEHSAFIIAADERLIKYAVRKRFPEIPGENAEVGRDYLEKLIQFPIRIPQLSEHEMETYINLLFTKLRISNASNFEDIRLKVIGRKVSSPFSSAYNSQNLDATLGAIPKPTELVDDFSLSGQVTPILAKGLNGNPRQCKRFLNTLLMRLEMATSKGIPLSKRVMAKLMLLEYFRPETFRIVSEWQSSQEGKPLEISKAEGSSRGKLTTTDGDENDLIKELTKDHWLKSWFENDPSLKDVDLRPYFFFSRDILKPFSIERARISSQGQEVLVQLVSDSKAFRDAAIKNPEKLSQSDGAAIFSTLTTKARQEENPNSRSELLKTICKICEVRSELSGELLIFLKGFPLKLLSPAIVPVVKQTFKALGDSDAISKLISVWASNKENTRLATAASAK